jgi:diguanylate cyclase (GGDEF)-like protein
MTTCDLSGSLIRLVVLAGALVGVPFLRKWVGGQLRSYVVVMGGLLCMVASEAMQLYFAPQVVISPPEIAWDAVCTQAIGYVAVLGGILLWVSDMRMTRDELRRSNLALQQVAATDFLTGLLSRRQASFLLDFEAARARRSGHPLGFIMIDLDHFKAVNDTYGHAAGDAVLVHVGGLLKSRLRASDIVSRYGGEEFLVLIPDATYESTVDLANNLRQMIEQSPAKHCGKEIQVRASFGVSVSHIDRGDSAQDAIARADAALYAAKAMGRNRVVGWEEIAAQAAQEAASGASQN